MKTLPPAPADVWEFEVECVSNPSESGLVVSRPDYPGLFFLNNTARFIWLSFQEGGPFSVLVERFASQFGIPTRRAEVDLAATLQIWAENLLAPPSNPSKLLTVPLSDSCSGCANIRNYHLGERQYRVEIEDLEFAEEVLPRLAHLTTQDVLPEITFRVFRDNGRIWIFCGETCVGAEPEVSVARTILLEEMARRSRPGTEWLAILHAAACGTSSECVIMPAATNSGKSTLAAALMQAGLQLFSDDSAAIDRQTGQVVRMPFALMLREGSWPVLEPYFPDLAAAPILERSGYNVRFVAPRIDHSAWSAAPKCLLFVQFQPGAAVELHPLSEFERLLRLQKSGFWVPHTKANISAFLAWVQSIPAYEMTYSSLSDATWIVKGLLSTD